MIRRALVLTALLAALPAAAEPIQGRASVVDADTLEIAGTRVRLHGVDAPEARQLCRAATGSPYRCGQVAALAIADRIGASPVRCTPTDRDRYGRVVAVCRLGRIDLGGWLVEQGHALAYRRYSRRYVWREDRARRLRRGMWAGTFVPPWLWRGGRAMSRQRYCFAEERRPCGSPGLVPIHIRAECAGAPPVDLSDCLVSRPKPWRLVIWEPLFTKAPAPPKARPFCCYIRTVVFYHAPYILRPWHRICRGGRGRWFADRPGSFETWGQVETRLTWDDLVAFEGEEFEIGGGRVVWARRRWWMCRLARRAERRRAGVVIEAGGEQ